MNVDDLKPKSQKIHWVHSKFISSEDTPTANPADPATLQRAAAIPLLPPITEMTWLRLVSFRTVTGQKHGCFSRRFHEMTWRSWRELREVSKVAKWLRKIVPFTKKWACLITSIFLSKKTRFQASPLLPPEKDESYLLFPSWKAFWIQLKFARLHVLEAILITTFVSIIWCKKRLKETRYLRAEDLEFDHKTALILISTSSVE